MKSQVLTQNNMAAIAALEKHIKMLTNAVLSLDDEQFFFEFGMYPESIAKLYEELEILKGNAKVQNPTNPSAKINGRRLRAAVKREMMNLLYPKFTKKRILSEFRSEIFTDLSAFENFFNSEYNLLPEFSSSFEDEIYRRIIE